jgi:hypothetical protein
MTPPAAIAVADQVAGLSLIHLRSHGRLRMSGEYSTGNLGPA